MSDKFLLGFTLGVYFLWFVKHIIDAIDERIKEKKRECTLKVAPMTNADRIRNMSDGELLDFLCGIDTYRVDGGQILWIGGYRMEDTRENISVWLQAEVKE